MKVMVTGGFGAMGSFATRYLVELGERPVVFSRRRDLKLVRDIAVGVDHEPGDIQDQGRLLEVMRQHRVEAVIHTAALMLPACRADPAACAGINVGGLANVLEAARTAGVGKVVFASTKGVYGPITGRHAHPTYEPISEDYPKNPQNIYDASRFFCERLGLQYWETHGMDFVALRFALTYGPGKMAHGAMAAGSSIIDNAMTGKETVIPRGGDQATDFIYNRDTGRALVLAALKPNPRHRQIHVGTGVGRTLSEFAAEVGKNIPGAAIDIGSGTDFMGLKDADGQPINTQGVFDIGRAREELGYEPRYGIEEGIRDYIELTRELGYYSQA